MNLGQRNRHFDITIGEWIERVTNELDFDAVGLWQLVASGEDGFELNGSELHAFVKACIIRLLESGAKVVGSSHEQSVDGHCDAKPEKIADRIVGDWVRGDLIADHDGIWFVRDYRM